jgi:hypothetical protein
MAIKEGAGESGRLLDEFWNVGEDGADRGPTAALEANIILAMCKDF